MGDREFIDSTETRLSALLANVGTPFSFGYEYDFGDGWQHDIVFEGSATVEPGVKYPRCVEGALACPPEDIGGVWGYMEFLEAIQNSQHEEHEDMLEWIGGSFDVEEFSLVATTKQMRRGLPDWRDDS